MRLGSVAFAAVMAVATSAFGQSAPELCETGRVVIEARFKDSSRRIGEIAHDLGGRLVSEAEPNVTVELPATSYREFLARLVPIGTLRSETRSTQDVTDQVADSEAQARAARASRQRLESVTGTAHDVPQHLLLEREIQRTSDEATSADARVREARRCTSIIRVGVVLTPTTPESIPTPQLPFPWLSELSLSRLLDTSSPPPEPSRVLRAFIEADFGLSYARAKDPSHFHGTGNFYAVNGSMRVLGEANPIGLYGGFDSAIGGGGGFLYGLQPLFGVGVPIGRGVAIGVASGPGFDAVTRDRVPLGMTLPIELDLNLDLAKWLAINAVVKDGWVVGSSERKHGSKHALFGDEGAAGIWLAFGNEHGYDYDADRISPKVGFFYRELMGTAMYEFALSLSAHHADYSE